MAREDYVEYQQQAEMATRKRLAERQDELSGLFGKYQEALRQTEGKDGQELLNILQLCQTYKPGEPAEKAVYLIASLTTLLASKAEPYLVIQTYEARKRSIELLEQQLRRPDTGADNKTEPADL